MDHARPPETTPRRGWTPVPPPMALALIAARWGPVAVDHERLCVPVEDAIREGRALLLPPPRPRPAD